MLLLNNAQHPAVESHGKNVNGAITNGAVGDRRSSRESALAFDEESLGLTQLHDDDDDDDEDDDESDIAEDEERRLRGPGGRSSRR